MKDSGKRQDFDSGAVRDTSEGKPRPDLISPFATNRLATWLGKGAEKYEPRNWEKGIPISRCLESLERHLVKYKMGLVDEDHMAAVACNVMFILHNEEAVKVGLLPASMDDLPFYLKHIQPEALVVPDDICGGPEGLERLPLKGAEDEGSCTVHEVRYGWVVAMNYKEHTTIKPVERGVCKPGNELAALSMAKEMLKEYKETINAK